MTGASAEPFSRPKSHNCIENDGGRKRALLVEEATMAAADVSYEISRHEWVACPGEDDAT